MPTQSNDSKDLKSQLTDIYSEILAYEKSVAVPLFQRPSLKHPKSLKILIGSVVLLFSLFLIFSVVEYFDVLGWVLGYVKIALLLSLLVSYLAIPTVQLIEIYADRTELIQFFKNPNKIIFDRLTETTSADSLLFKALETHSLESLQLAKNKISSQHRAIEKRLGILAGSLEKVGIVPGLITLVIAAVSSKQNEILALSVSMAIFSVYLFALIVHHSLPRLSLYEKLLEDAINKRNK